MQNKIEKFEDFIAWQKARGLTREIYKITNLPSFSRDFGSKDQIRRAAVSIMSNIAEGFERGRPSEFHQFLSIAKDRAPSCDRSSMSRLMLTTFLDLGFTNYWLMRPKSDKSWAGFAYPLKDEKQRTRFVLSLMTHYS